MTPKQKAQQLGQKYYVEVLYGNSSDYSEKMLQVFKIKAKTCALITLDEILDKDGYNNDYWKEVKQEIEKL